MPEDSDLEPNQALGYWQLSGGRKYVRRTEDARGPAAGLRRPAYVANDPTPLRMELVRVAQDK